MCRKDITESNVEIKQKILMNNTERGSLSIKVLETLYEDIKNLKSEIFYKINAHVISCNNTCSIQIIKRVIENIDITSDIWFWVIKSVDTVADRFEEDIRINMVSNL